MDVLRHAWSSAFGQSVLALKRARSGQNREFRPRFVNMDVKWLNLLRGFRKLRYSETAQGWLRLLSKCRGVPLCVKVAFCGFLQQLQQEFPFVLLFFPLCSFLVGEEEGVSFNFGLLTLQ